jgi:collagen type V/XI/XXIV/XXVII alpha
MVQHITVGPDTLPDDVPYNAGLAARDVTEQDWATFRNYLLPDHTARRNEAVVDRKLRDEGRSEDGVSTRSGKSHAEVHLGRIHSSSEAGEERLDAGQLRSHAIATVQEWNTSFFGPRGITIRLNPITQQEEGSRMPGAWDQSFEEHSGSSQGQDQQARAGWRRHLDRVKVTDNMLRIGDSFVADVNGLKIGSMVMDGRGIRMDGSQPQPHPGFGGPVPGGFGRGGPPGGFPRGSPFGGWGRGGFGAPHHHHHHHGSPRGRSFDEGPAVGAKQRSHSVSSISSSSSSSSSDSDSSLDDLPDYDDLHEKQLPVYADRLENWVNTPDTIRTKQDLSDLRAELKMVKRAGFDPDVDKKALRQHVKTLKGQWKGVRKEQKRVLRERKRERKTRRRAEKKERRERRKEVKRSQREMGRERRDSRREEKRERREDKRERRECRREEKRERRQCDRSPWPTPYGVPGFSGPPGAPGVSGVPGVPGVPGMSNPPAPHASYGRSGSWAGMFGNRGLFGPQGSFGPQVSHPNVFPHGVFPPPGVPFSHEATHSAPPGAWPEDRKVNPEESGDGQEAGVVEGPSREQRMKELEDELEKKILALDSLDEGKERREGEKEVEALVDRLDGLRMEADEAYARELAAHT